MRAKILFPDERRRPTKKLLYINSLYLISPARSDVSSPYFISSAYQILRSPFGLNEKPLPFSSHCIRLYTSASLPQRFEAYGSRKQTKTYYGSSPSYLQCEKYSKLNNIILRVYMKTLFDFLTLYDNIYLAFVKM